MCTLSSKQGNAKSKTTVRCPCTPPSLAENKGEQYQALVRLASEPSSSHSTVRSLKPARGEQKTSQQRLVKVSTPATQHRPCKERHMQKCVWHHYLWL